LNLDDRLGPAKRFRQALVFAAQPLLLGDQRTVRLRLPPATLGDQRA
jgi:hypothetical protein